MALLFDTHRAVKDLEEAGFGEAQAEAVVEMIGGAVGENVATKADIETLEREMKALEQRVTAEMKALEQRMIIKLGAIVFAASGVVIALIKLIP